MNKDLQKKRIGLLLGSFNPVHNGHIELAQEVLKAELVDTVWFVVSPHNPDKDKNILAPFKDRAEMVRRAVCDIPGVEVSLVEENLPVPSYTYVTLRFLREQYPDREFSIIAGADVARSIINWDESQEIIENHDLIVRLRTDEAFSCHESIRVRFVPGFMPVSSTDVRSSIVDEEKLRALLPEAVLSYIADKGLYKS